MPQRNASCRVELSHWFILCGSRGHSSRIWVYNTHAQVISYGSKSCHMKTSHVTHSRCTPNFATSSGLRRSKSDMSPTPSRECITPRYVSSLRSSRNVCVLQCVAVWCSVLQCVAVCCSVLQCVAVCCSELSIQYECITPACVSSLRSFMNVCVCVMFVCIRCIICAWYVLSVWSSRNACV